MDKEALKKDFEAAARAAGKSIHDHMLDTYADMKTTARDSIIRVGIVCFIIGALLGAVAL